MNLLFSTKIIVFIYYFLILIIEVAAMQLMHLCQGKFINAPLENNQIEGTSLYTILFTVFVAPQY